MNSAVIIDIALLAVLLIGTAIGARRGLWASLAGFVIFLLALCGAALVAGSFTPKLVGAVQPVLEQHMEQRVDAALREYGEELQKEESASAGETDDVTALVQSVLEQLGYRENFRESLSDEIGETIRETGVSVVSAVAASLLQTVVHTVLFVVSFVVLTLLLRVLWNAMGLVTHLPGVHLLNTLGGAALGLGEGVLLIFLVIWALERFGVNIAASTVEDTYLLRFFMTEGPMGLLSLL